MPSRNPSRSVLRSLCAQVQADDGVDPRLQARGRPSPGQEGRSTGGRKSLQLCRQVSETLELALAGESHDPVLNGLRIAAVVPSPDVSRLRVTVTPLPGEPFDPPRILAHLDRASAWLRCEVASAVHRRRAPSLTFQVAIPGDN